MSSALLSCLGVSGWGPLHWWLRHGGEPEAVLARLRRAWRLAAAAGAVDPSAPLLLAGLLRSSNDLIPLVAAPLLPCRGGPAFRHRLVCRPGPPRLHLRSWECPSAAVPWRCCGRERRLDAALLSQGAQLPVATLSRSSAPPCQVADPPAAVLSAAVLHAGRWL